VPGAHVCGEVLPRVPLAGNIDDTGELALERVLMIERGSDYWAWSWYEMREGAIAAPLHSAARRPLPLVAGMLGNETWNGLVVLRANWRTLIPALAVLVVFYIFIQFLIAGGRMVQTLYAPTMLGLVFYALLYIVTLRMVAGTLEEMNGGPWSSFT